MTRILLLKDHYPLFTNPIWNEYQKKIEDTPELNVFFQKIAEEETKKFRELGDEFCDSFDPSFIKGEIMETFFDKVNRHNDKLMESMTSVDGWEDLFTIDEIDESVSPKYTIHCGDYPSGDYIVLATDIQLDSHYNGVARYRENEDS